MLTASCLHAARQIAITEIDPHSTWPQLIHMLQKRGGITCTEPCWVASSGAKKRGLIPLHQSAWHARAMQMSKAAIASIICREQRLSAS